MGPRIQKKIGARNITVLMSVMSVLAVTFTDHNNHINFSLSLFLVVPLMINVEKTDTRLRSEVFSLENLWT